LLRTHPVYALILMLVLGGTLMLAVAGEGISRGVSQAGNPGGQAETKQMPCYVQAYRQHVLRDLKDTRPLADNENGFLAWDTSPIMDSLNVAGSLVPEAYPGKFVEVADKILAARDDRTGKPDYAGHLRRGWGSSRYSNDKKSRVVFLVHTGLIVYPLLRFAELQRLEGRHEFDDKIRQYIRDAEDSLAEFDRDWVEEGPEGYYVSERGEPTTLGDVAEKALPVNMMAAAGRCDVLLYRLTGNQKYLNIATRLARYLKDRWKVKRVGDTETLVWSYWYSWPGHADVPEDVGHGGIEIEFMELCFEDKIVFDRHDVDRLLATFETTVFNGSAFSWRVDGSGGFGKANAGRWIVWSKYDPRVLEILRSAYPCETAGPTLDYYSLAWLARASEVK